MNIMDALAISFSTFYLSYVMSRTDGPSNIFKRLRGTRVIGPVVACFYCAAFWVALALYAAMLIAPPVVYVFAAAGAASFAYRWSGGEHA